MCSGHSDVRSEPSKLKKFSSDGSDHGFRGFCLAFGPPGFHWLQMSFQAIFRDATILNALLCCILTWFLIVFWELVHSAGLSHRPSIKYWQLPESTTIQISEGMSERRKRGAAGASDGALAFKKKLKSDDEILAKVAKLSEAEKKKPKDSV